MREEARERTVTAAFEVRMPAERGLELVRPAVAAEEWEPAGAIEERLLPRISRSRGCGAAPEAGAEGQAAQRAAEQGLARLHGQARPPGAVDVGVSDDAAEAVELGLEGARRTGRMVEGIERLLARFCEAERPPQEDAVRSRVGHRDDELAAGVSRSLGKVALPVWHGGERVVRENEVERL